MKPTRNFNYNICNYYPIVLYFEISLYDVSSPSGDYNKPCIFFRETSESLYEVFAFDSVEQIKTRYKTPELIIEDAVKAYFNNHKYENHVVAFTTFTGFEEVFGNKKFQVTYEQHAKMS